MPTQTIFVIDDHAADRDIVESGSIVDVTLF
jgi:hypothetical protein